MDKREESTFIEIQSQLRDEGAAREILSLAEKLAKGQFKNDRDDALGAMMLMIDAAALAFWKSPNRPKCCELHELNFLSHALGAIQAEYCTLRIGARSAKGKSA